MQRALIASAMVYASGASAPAAFVGGGVVSLASWNAAASSAYGQTVSVWRLYLAFDGTSSTVDTVNSVFNANISVASTLVQTPAPFGGNFAPNSGFFGFEPRLQWDTYVSIGALTDTTTVGNDGNGVTFSDFGLINNSGWFNSSPPNLLGQAQPDAQFGTGLNLVFIAQFTMLEIGTPPGDIVDLRTDGNIGCADGRIFGTMSVGLNSQANPSIQNIWICIPTPGAVSAFVLAGGIAARRRQR